MTVKIAPSILSADFTRLGEEISRVPNADVIHVDVMDNHFVENLTFGLPVVKSLKATTEKPLDVHLMIEDPDRWAPKYAELGVWNVTFHAEAASDILQTARDIKAQGSKVGLSVKPGTDIKQYAEVLHEFDVILIMTVEPGFGGQKYIADMNDKVRWVRQFAQQNSLDVHIEVDGGVDAQTIAAAAEAGADLFVAGSAVYGAEDPAAAVDDLRKLADDASVTA